MSEVLPGFPMTTPDGSTVWPEVSAKRQKLQEAVAETFETFRTKLNGDFEKIEADLEEILYENLKLRQKLERRGAFIAMDTQFKPEYKQLTTLLEQFCKSDVQVPQDGYIDFLPGCKLDRYGVPSIRLAPQIGHLFLVSPSYDKSRPTPLPAPLPVDEQRTCFNCDQPGHSVAACPLPRNRPNIEANRRRHQRETSLVRYVAAELPAERYSAFRPGHFSAELREALGMDFSIMPPWAPSYQSYGRPPSYRSVPLPGLDPFPPPQPHYLHLLFDKERVELRLQAFLKSTVGLGGDLDQFSQANVREFFRLLPGFRQFSPYVDFDGKALQARKDEDWRRQFFKDAACAPCIHALLQHISHLRHLVAAERRGAQLRLPVPDTFASDVEMEEAGASRWHDLQAALAPHRTRVRPEINSNGGAELLEL